MVAAALRSIGSVATNGEGANMDAGLVAALAADRTPPWPPSRWTRCMFPTWPTRSNRPSSCC